MHNDHRSSATLATTHLLTALLGEEELSRREGLEQTPRRMAKALAELTEGYAVDTHALVTTFPREGDTMITVRDIPFASLCEHHVLPFTGTVSVAYVPGERIIGLSKIPRLVRAITRRLQVQERIGIMLADVLEEVLTPAGVMIVVRARHTCMALRGVESPGEMVTSVVRGCFDKPEARAEAMHFFRSES